MKIEWSKYPSQLQEFLMSQFPQVITQISNPRMLASFLQDLAELKIPLLEYSLLRDAVMSTIFNLYSNENQKNIDLKEKNTDRGLSLLIFYLSKNGVKKQDIPPNVFTVIVNEITRCSAIMTVGQERTLVTG